MKERTNVGRAVAWSLLGSSCIIPVLVWLTLQGVNAWPVLGSMVLLWFVGIQYGRKATTND